MSKSTEAAKHKKMAADLLKRGIFHGKRTSSPYPNSGGMTMTSGPGSSKYQRLLGVKGVRYPISPGTGSEGGRHNPGKGVKQRNKNASRQGGRSAAVSKSRTH